MSVKVHEPVCEDSAQDLYFWFDHFLGDQLKDEWLSVGTGSAVVVDAQTGGIVRITTGAIATNAHRIDWGDIRSLLVTKKVTIEVRAKLETTTQVDSITIGLWFDGAQNIEFVHWDGFPFAPNWGIVTESVAQTTEDSGIAIDTDYHIFRIECFPTGEVHFYIDGVETANSPITTNITASHLQPYINIITNENATKYIDIDYVVVRQER